MKDIYHIVTSSFYPEVGGMESSILRITNLLSKHKDNKILIYVLKSSNLSDNHIFQNGVTTIYLSNRITKLLTPVKNTSAYGEESFRIRYLILKDEILNIIALNKNSRNFIISFFASSNGFLAQQVACDLDIPHIASIRGSDLNIYGHIREYFAAFSFLLSKSNFIITTSNEQKQIIGSYFNRYENVETIHNSIENIDQLPVFTPVSNQKFIRIFTDVGLNFKKGTHLLIDAIVALHKKKQVKVCLEISGKADSEQMEYFQSLINQISKESNGLVKYTGFKSQEQIIDSLLNSDLFIHPSISEGCSNSRILAYAIGIPVITSNTGEVKDIADILQNVYTFPALDLAALEKTILDVSLEIRHNAPVVLMDQLNKLREYFNSKRELAEWQKALSLFKVKNDSVIKFEQRKVLFFVHDGTGLGHLQRVSRIAAELQGNFSCLILSGHRQMANIVPEICEYVHIPSLDSLLERKSRYWGRKPFWETSLKNVLKFRSEIINSVITSFDPDVIFIDFLPLGKNEELKYAVMNHRAKKYFILRGVLDDPSNIRIDILGGMGEYALEKFFSKIIVTCDEKIIDVSKEYALSENISNKLVYAGYVAPSFDEMDMQQARIERGLQSHELWAICSAGGGMLGEKLINECTRLAKRYEHIKFDIILGPKSAKRWNRLTINRYDDGNIRYHKDHFNLSLLHAAGDIIINPGGYNSLVEALQSKQRNAIIIVPAQLRTNDEQYIHAKRLMKYVDNIFPLTSASELDSIFDQVVKTLQMENIGSPIQFKNRLNFNGANNIARIIKTDI